MRKVLYSYMCFTFAQIGSSACIRGCSGLGFYNFCWLMQYSLACWGSPRRLWLLVWSYMRILQAPTCAVKRKSNHFFFLLPLLLPCPRSGVYRHVFKYHVLKHVVGIDSCIMVKACTGDSSHRHHKFHWNHTWDCLGCWIWWLVQLTTPCLETSWSWKCFVYHDHFMVVHVTDSQGLGVPSRIGREDTYHPCSNQESCTLHHASMTFGATEQMVVVRVCVYN